MSNSGSNLPEKSRLPLADLLNKPILNSAPPFKTIYEDRELTPSPKRPCSQNPLQDPLHQPKRARSVFISSPNEIQPPQATFKKLLRTQSESAVFRQPECAVKTAVERISSQPNLVGDGSKTYLLPIVEGKHSDLKEISASVLVGLMSGQYSEEVQRFEIIDCRYPYEFTGGHIEGAINLHTRSQVYQRFFGTKQPCIGVREGKRHIIVFHCEFSSQRGPDMCRYVRDCDRKMNEYPYLHYPELYVLRGGYKAFFEQFKSYCVPQEYLQMIDAKYVEDCRFYKNLSKTDDCRKKRSIPSFHTLNR